MSAWHYIQDGQTVGPVNEGQLRNLISTGTVTATTQVWRDGMSEWAEAHKTELHSLFVPKTHSPRVSTTPAVEDRVTPAGFKDPTTISMWVRGLMIAGIVLTFFSLGLGLVEFAALQRGETPNEDELSLLDIVTILLGLLQVSLYLGTAVLFLCWLHRSNANARALGAEGMTFTPGWSVGWYFVPFANLWKPYQVMKEIWKTSKSPSDWVDEPDPPLLGWWWTLWILGNLLGQASFRFSMRATTPNELLIANVITLVSDAVDVPLTIMAIMVVSSITSMQASHASKVE